MLNKVIYRPIKVSQNKTVHELVFIFDARSSFTLSSDSLRGVLELYEQFMVPIELSNNFASLRDYKAAMQAAQEDTVIINIEKAV